MSVYYADDLVTLHLGDCLDVLPTLADASVDAVICDPPYELTGSGRGGFMGQSWDSTGIAFNAEVWRQCRRVLKPGGHLAAFGATRTYHRMTCAIEDAGFEIRDSLHWIYGSGMPKGQNIGKSIDRQRNDRPQILQVTAFLAAARDAAGVTHKQIDAEFGFNGMVHHWTAIASKTAAVPRPEQWGRLKALLGFDDTEILPLVEMLNDRKGELGEAWGQRDVVGAGFRVRGESDVQIAPVSTGAYDITAPATEAAAQWHGWNTQLRPAHEPIVLARKSTGFNTTVANVLQYGTGAINVDACRTEAGQDCREKCASVVGIDSPRNGDTLGEWTGAREDSAHVAGRWPANVLLSHTPLLDEDGCVIGDACADGCAPGCPAAEVDRQSGFSRGGRSWRGERHGAVYNAPSGPNSVRGHDDSGGASRFFPAFRYEAKAPASERPRLTDGTAHTTVKPLALMQWLVRLITPPGGLVLDPFAGSGTTLEAAVVEGFRVVGVEREPPYAELCVQRLSKPLATALFGLDP